MALLDRAVLGPLAWSHPLTTLADAKDDFPSLLGVRFLYPLRRVVLDFAGGAIYTAQLSGGVSFLDSVVSLYRGYDLPGAFDLGGRRGDTSSILSISGVSTVGMGDLEGAAWDRGMRERAARLAFKPPQYATLRYRDGAAVRTARLPADYEGRVPPDLTDTEPPVASPFQQPGYYLVQNGRAYLLPSGTVWLPGGGAKVLPIGGLAPVVPSASVGSYRVLRLPPLPQGYLWEELGWRTPTGAAVFPSGGEASVPTAASPVEIPDGAPFSPGRRNVDYDPTTKRFTLR